MFQAQLKEQSTFPNFSLLDGPFFMRGLDPHGKVELSSLDLGPVEDLLVLDFLGPSSSFCGMTKLLSILWAKIMDFVLCLFFSFFFFFLR